VKYEMNELVKILEIILDGETQRAKDPKLRKRLAYALGIVRRIQARFPPRYYTMIRCMDKREPPYLKHLGVPRHISKRNWGAAKRQRELAKYNLEQFLDRESTQF